MDKDKPAPGPAYLKSFLQSKGKKVKVIDGKLKLPSGHGLDLTLNPEYKKDFMLKELYSGWDLLEEELFISSFKRIKVKP